MRFKIINNFNFGLLYLGGNTFSCANCSSEFTMFKIKNMFKKYKNIDKIYFQGFSKGIRTIFTFKFYSFIGIFI